jgi:hypothetical protein
MRRILFAGSFILVEGPADQRLYGKFIINRRCQTMPCGSKDNVLAALAILRADNCSGVIGIIDADFAHAAGEALGHDNAFMTDDHDAEMMLLRSQAVTSFIHEHCSPAKHSDWEQKFGEVVVARLMREAMKTGCLLWFSCVNKMNLNFDELKPERFMDRDTLLIDRVKLVHHVKERSRRQDIPHNELVDGLLEMQKRSSDPFQVARGHDVVDYLGFALRTAIGSCTHLQTTIETIESHLRVAYTIQEFSTTGLYASAIEWEQRHSPYEVFVKVPALRPAAGDDYADLTAPAI